MKRLKNRRQRRKLQLPEFDPNLCANCRAYLQKEDKYCRCCGTARGRGAFVPKDNAIVYLYGPPVKRKYKCAVCAHVWIDCCVGGKDVKFCPECGEKTPQKQLERVFWNPPFHRSSSEEPFDEADRPQLLTEEEILKLLRARPAEGQTRLWDRDVFEKMKSAGFPLPDQMDDREKGEHFYPCTETEDEQFLLAAKILEIKGESLHAFPYARCPHCDNNILAAISYRVLDAEYNTVYENFHVPSPPDALVWHEYRNWILGEKNRDAYFVPYAYLCLRCGIRFGELSENAFLNEKEKKKNDT